MKNLERMGWAAAGMLTAFWVMYLQNGNSLKTASVDVPRGVVYDKCLASGRDKTTCDALIRVLAREAEQTRIEIAQERCKQAGDPFPEACGYTFAKKTQ